jgi:hypothetical protein
MKAGIGIAFATLPEIKPRGGALPKCYCFWFHRERTERTFCAARIIASMIEATS